MKESGVPIARSLLVQRCRRDASLLKIFVDNTRAAVNAVSSAQRAHSVLMVGAERVLSFLTALAVELCEISVEEQQLRVLTPFLLEGITPHIGGSPVQGVLRKSCFMILAQLSRATALSATMLQSLWRTLTLALKGASGAEAEEIAFSMSILLAYQQYKLDSTTLVQLFAIQRDSRSVLLRLLEQLASKFDIKIALKSLVSSFISASGANDPDFIVYFTSLMSSNFFDAKIAEDVTFQFLIGNKSTSREFSIQALRYLVQRYPEAIDAAISQANEQGSSTANELLKAATMDSPFMVGESSLLVAMRSPIDSIRSQALNAFTEKLELGVDSTLAIISICEAVCEVLKEPTSSLASAAWNTDVLVRISAYLPASSVLSTFVTTWQQWSTRVTHSKAATSILISILNCASIPTVSSALLQLKIGKAWLLSTICTTAQGILLLKTTDEVPSKRIELIEEVASKAVDCARKLSGAFPYFRNIPKKKTEIYDALPVSIAELLMTDLETFKLEAGTLSSTAFDESTTMALADLYHRVLKIVQNDEILSAAVMSFHLPILIELTSMNISFLEGRVCEYFAVAISAMQAKEKEYSFRWFTSFSSEFFSDDNFESPSRKLLMSLLRSSNFALVEMIGPTLMTLFKPHPQMILLKIAFAKERIDELARTAALCSLTPFVFSVNESSVSSFVTSQLRPDISCSLLMCLPLIFDGISSTSKLVRDASFELANSFARLPPKTSICFEDDESSVFSNRLSVSDLASFMNSLCELKQSGGIELQGVSLTSDFHDLAAAQVSNVKGILLELLKVIGWNHVDCSTGLLRITQGHLSLHEAWDIFSTLFKSQVEESEATRRLYPVLFTCLRQVEDVDKATLAMVSQTIIELITRKCDIRKQLLSLYHEKWAMYMSTDQRRSIFQAMLIAHEQAPGQQDIVNALTEACIDSKTIIDILFQNLTNFIDSGLDATGDDPIVVDDDEQDSGVSIKLQRLGSILEVMNGHITKVEDKNHNSLSSLLLLQFKALALLNHGVSSAVVGAEYVKTLILDGARACIEVGKGNDIIKPGGITMKLKRKMTEIYTEDRIVPDFSEILLALQTSNTVSLQFSALNTIGVLLTFAPGLVPVCVGNLGKLLTRTSTEKSFLKTARLERGNLIEDILRKLHSILKFPEDRQVAPQLFFQPLFFHFTHMSTSQRNYLVKISIDIFGDCSCPAMISVLLCHSLFSYEPEKLDATNSKGFEGLVLLSRAAQRKAQRALRNSIPHEIFQLATEIPVRMPGDTQVSSIVNMLRFAHILFLEIFSGTSSSPVVVDKSAILVDASMLKSYSKEIYAEMNPSSIPSDQSILCTLLLLHLEYIFEALENRALHRALVLVDKSGDIDLQSLLLEIAEHSLQLVASVSEYVGKSSENADTTFEITLADQVFRISSDSFADTVYNWSLEIIKSLQRLLDTPTFIAVLQELLDHEHVSIRQRAVQMLTDRLSNVKIAQQNEEQSLYLDLFNRLRDTLRDCAVSLTDPSDSIASKKFIGLMHSSTICLDVIAKALGKGSLWIDALEVIYQEVVGISDKVDNQLSRQGSSEHQLDLLKLQSSLFLCSGTICGIIGARSLTLLPTLMNLMTNSSLRLSENAILLSSRSERGEQHDDELKTLVLALRSIVATITVIAMEAPSFIHPYLYTSINSMLKIYALQELHEYDLIRNDIDRCFTAMSTNIPLRLALPQLHFHLSAILSQGHIQAKRFMEYLGSIWGTLDRNFLAHSLNEVSSLVVITLDYRRQYGDSAMPESVDEAIVGSAVEFCMKLTEAELKMFLMKLLEWKNLLSDEASNKRFARGTTFFHLVSALCSKLKIIFVPLMVYVWPTALSALEAASHLKSSNKRKAGNESTESADNSEILRQTQWVLECTKLACAYDSEGVIDEVSIVTQSYLLLSFCRNVSSLCTLGSVISYQLFLEHSLKALHILHSWNSM